MNKCINPDPNRCCYFELLNYGGFLVRFCGDYELCGKCHTFASGAFGIGEKRKVNIPSCANNINFIVQISKSPCLWSNIYKENYTSCDQLCFLTYGLIFDPCCTPIPCTSLKLLKCIFPSGVFVPMDSCEQDCLNTCCTNPCNDSCNIPNIDNNCCNQSNLCDDSYDNTSCNSFESYYNTSDNNCFDCTCESYSNQYNCSDSYENNYYSSNNNEYNNYYNNTNY